MTQSNFQRLAHQFMRNAVQVGKGDNTWIEYVGPKAEILATACAAEVRALGANPVMIDSGSSFINACIPRLSAAQINAYGEGMLKIMMEVQTYIRVTDAADDKKIALSPETRGLYKKAMRPMTNYRVDHTRWLVVAAPTEEFAASCGFSFNDFLAFYLDACLLDYSKMAEAVRPLQKIMTEGKTVRLVSPSQETDLTFSIEGITAIPCTGKVNIPDGECYTAPVRDSLQGTIKFVMPCYQGQLFTSVRLVFDRGRIVEATAENEERTKALNAILDIDKGARYIGEFAIGFNPRVQKPTGDSLFDEKIDGSLHLAAGSSYADAFNGNQSAIHWDMVHIQRPEFGGGEIWIDDRLIRKNGIFVVPELLALNPENLKASTATKPGSRWKAAPLSVEP